MTNLRDNLMKPEDIHDCFNTQTDVITRLENTNRKLAELNQLSEQKFKRVQKSFVNAASMLQKMQGDLGFIHGAIKKLTHLSALEKSVVDKTTAIVQSKTGDIDVSANTNTEAQPVEVKNEVSEQKVEEQKNENVIEEGKAPEEINEPEEKTEEVVQPASTEEKIEAQEEKQENVPEENKAPEEVNEPKVKAEEEKTEDVAPPASTEEENTETQEEKHEGQQPEKKKKNKKKSKH